MVLCTSVDVNEEHIKQLRAKTAEEVVQGRIFSIPTDVKNQIEIIITFGNYDDSISVAELSQLPNLKWIQAMSSGIEQLPTEWIRNNGIILTSSRGVHAIPISEYVLCMLLYSAKRIAKFHYLQSNMVWGSGEEMYELYGKTIGVLGTGSIGREIAKKVKAFGMLTLGLNRDGRPIQGFDRVYSLNQLHELIPQCDYICSALPSTPNTRNLISAKQIAQMKDGILFINVGRGDLVVEEDLIEALQTRKIRAAALDVFRDEPLSYEHPLWQQENLMITPHVSSKTNMYISRVLDIFMENYCCFKTNQISEMMNRVE